jgi:hypothetical protein
MFVKYLPNLNRNFTNMSVLRKFVKTYLYPMGVKTGEYGWNSAPEPGGDCESVSS